nr:hypothetical transcript [Hymenolepis microstoma]
MNQQQGHWVPANPKYVQGPVQFAYPPNQQQQRLQPFDVTMSHPEFQGNPTSFQIFKPMPMTMQTQAMVQSQETTYCNQFIIEQPQPQRWSIQRLKQSSLKRQVRSHIPSQHDEANFPQLRS